MNKNDLRYRKTDDAIRNAFLECVDREEFDDVHVSDICRIAGISRRAFYDHYTDKYALLEAVYADLKKDIRDNLTDGIITQMIEGDFLEPTRWHMQQVYEHRDIIRPLLMVDKTEYTKMCIELYYDLPWSRVVPDYYKKKEDPRVFLSISYLVNGMVGFIAEWLNNIDRYTFDEALMLMTSLCERPAALFIKQIM
ncbi:MAG: TetR/AcrR family transcriptional regulator [Lachnospiraceae bacterium]|nr:TetR/AcrR family transcriptional regulator [Lachnospiraceae bacterium]